MKVEMKKDGNVVTINVSERLDSATAEEFKTKTVETCKGSSSVIINMSDLEYISSAGLRSILSLKKSLTDGADLRIENAHGIVKEVIDISGFDELIR